MKQELVDLKKLETDLKQVPFVEEVIQTDLQHLVDDIFGMGNYIIIKLEGDK